MPFSVYQLQLRAFYALQDTRTPTLINLSVNATLVAVGLVLYAVLPTRVAVLGLAAGHAASFTVGAVVCSQVLRRRIGDYGAALVVRTAVRALAACAAPALLAAAAVWAAERWLGTGQVGSLTGLLVGAAALGAGYVQLARRFALVEVEQVAGPVLSRLGVRRS